MRFDIRGRQAGKTHDMIEWMRAAPEGTLRVLVSHDNAGAMAALRQAREDDDNLLESWQFIGIEEQVRYRPFPVQAGMYQHVELGIDNADLILQRMVPLYPLRFVTATGDTE